MKVLSYLEFWVHLTDFSEDALIYAKAIEKKGYVCNAIFYSQPFKPGLITELFEGFIPTGHEQDYSHTSDYDFQFKTKRYMIHYGLEITITNSYPRTLDDFITDCQRAGIELEWKL